MSKKVNKAWNYRGKLSQESKSVVEKVMATQVLKNNKMTQDEAVDFIIKNYKVL